MLETLKAEFNMGHAVGDTIFFRLHGRPSLTHRGVVLAVHRSLRTYHIQRQSHSIGETVSERELLRPEEVVALRLMQEQFNG